VGVGHSLQHGLHQVSGSMLHCLTVSLSQWLTALLIQSGLLMLRVT